MDVRFDSLDGKVLEVPKDVASGRFGSLFWRLMAAGEISSVFVMFGGRFGKDWFNLRCFDPLGVRVSVDRWLCYDRKVFAWEDVLRVVVESFIVDEGEYEDETYRRWGVEAYNERRLVGFVSRSLNELELKLSLRGV